MDNTNEIIICKDKYPTIDDFENAIKKVIMVLLNNGYIMTVRYDEPGLGIVSIEYEHNDKSLGSDYPYWLSPTEAESIIYD